jgi:hypothetical protein
VVAIAQAAAPGDPAVCALGVGALTGLIRTGRWDLAPRTPVAEPHGLGSARQVAAVCWRWLVAAAAGGGGGGGLL